MEETMMELEGVEFNREDTYQGGRTPFWPASTPFLVGQAGQDTILGGQDANLAGQTPFFWLARKLDCLLAG